MLIDFGTIIEFHNRKFYDVSRDSISERIRYEKLERNYKLQLSVKERTDGIREERIVAKDNKRISICQGTQELSI
jgi:hypothetical protein